MRLADLGQEGAEEEMVEKLKRLHQEISDLADSLSKSHPLQQQV